MLAEHGPLMRCLALFSLLTLSLNACDGTAKKSSDAAKQAAIAKSQMCATGKAKFDEKAGECVCPAEQTWNGSHCEDNQALSSKQACEGVHGVWQAGADTCQCPTDLEWDGAACVTASGNEVQKACAANGGTWDETQKTCMCPGDLDSKDIVDSTCQVKEAAAGSVTPSYEAGRVEAACKLARGIWYADEAYCFCSKDRVLVGQRCIKLQGKLTPEICRQAVYPGRWNAGTCGCKAPTLMTADGPAVAAADELQKWLFSPARGGCVPVKASTEAMHRRVCESSLNKGKWDSRNSRCRCQVGQVWNAELCVAREKTSSRQVCESDFNRGRWHSERKSCSCPLGQIWLNQECQFMSVVSDEAACTSELNHGRWNSRQSRCICPGLKRWAPALKTCETGNLSAAQQLCLQSGGRIGATKGSCLCAPQMDKKTFLPQNFEYCVNPAARTEPIPAWFLTKLGLPAKGKLHN